MMDGLLPDYAALAGFAKSWGLLYMAAIFAGGVGYALWPANRARFEAAAQLPLEEDER